ncbi:hypothetical protein RRSWK_01656 [Rhodopirellula sp. SWK7]|nr:hypothetical protein RRSWK_01656 [Rhodopirellula sp. SWK7]
MQVGCGGPPENTVLEPPADFKLVPIEESQNYNTTISNQMNPDK